MKILGIIKNILLDLIIVFLIFIIGIEFLNKNKPLNICNHYMFKVLTGSMENTLHIGDYIIIKKEKEYKVNDIVTYKLDDAYVTHRIISMEGNQIITKGDANEIEDEPIVKDDIVGKFVYKSNIINFIMNNKIIICIVVFGLLILDSIITKKKEVEQGEE